MALPQARARGRLTVVATGLATTALAFTSIGVAAQDNVVTLGSYHSNAEPKRALEAMVAYCEGETGLDVVINTTEHEKFQDNFTSYLQGLPDDVFTWFAGYRMRYFADQGLVGPVTDVWEGIDNYGEGFRKAAQGNDGEMYIIPLSNYPWVVMYRKSIFEEKGYAIPETWDDFLALAEQMKADGLIPMAFGDFQGWPAQGTFDILNMRLNGYDFHIGLMGGNEKWTDERVKNVFETWRALMPYLSDGGVGLRWEEAANQLIDGSAGMYFLGTFALGPSVGTPAEGDIAFFPFPKLGTEFDDELGIDAPIDGYMIAPNPKNPEGAKALLACFTTAGAQEAYYLGDPSQVMAANDVDPSIYSDVIKASADVIAASGAIAQFLDRDTIPAFAGTTGMQERLQNFLGDPEQDLDAYLQSIQDLWDQIAAEQ